MVKTLKLPPDEAMREMAKVAIEMATENLAIIALSLAGDMRRGDCPKVDGPDALEAFARTIRNNNKQLYGQQSRPHA